MMPSMINDPVFVQDWENQSVLMIGAARQGSALAEYLLRHGASVIINDQRPASQIPEMQQALSEAVLSHPGRLQWVLGGHPTSVLDDVTLVCISGGVPLSNPLVLEAGRRGIPLSNDSQIFMQVKPCKVIGITGSAGKTTTTTLVGRIAAAGQAALSGDRVYRKVWVGGNIGVPLIADVDEMQADDLAVMELSSFQLEIMKISPEVAAILNITPNHLDRHSTMEAYTAAKARILDFQSGEDAAVLGRGDEGAMSIADHVKGHLFTFGLSDLPADQYGSYYRQGSLFLHMPDRSDVKVLEQAEIQLRGQHNLLNVLAAAAIIAAAGLPLNSVPDGVRDFRGVAHRLAFVRQWGGADWYNDSIATAPERAMAAINSFDEPLVLLVGGRDKNLPWQDFSRLALARVDHLIAFGEAAGKIINTVLAVETAESGAILRSPLARQSALSVERVENMAAAVTRAASLVRPGDVVLLSPGGTSFDEFRDFEERGDIFSRLVRELP